MLFFAKIQILNFISSMQSGTGSVPPECFGVHLQILLNPIKQPFMLPNLFIAISVYVEQVG